MYLSKEGEGVRPQIQTFLYVILAIMKISSLLIWTLEVILGGLVQGVFKTYIQD